MISVEHLHREYGSFVAVDDLSFSVQSGEIVGLIGPNGAGKTTTLRSLAGILRPTSGRVAIDGHDIVAQPIEAKRRLALMPGPRPPPPAGAPTAAHDIAAQPIEARRRLAFMPDEPHLFEYLTVEEHLRLVARLYTVDDFERRGATLL